MLRAYSKSAGTGKQDRGLEARAPSADYAQTLLATFGLAAAVPPAAADVHPAFAWAESGAMALTGLAGGPPVAVPGRLAVAAAGALRAFAALAGDAAVAGIDGAALLGERAAIAGWARRGRVSVGGSCRLVRARDGWLAVNLPRADDVASVPAWLGSAVADDPWATIADVVRGRSVGPLVARARLLGLAVAAAVPPPPVAPRWMTLACCGTPASRPPSVPPLVVDLSALWAGPLCAELLARAGARVVKVESTRRPDGGRRGPAAFFDLLNGSKESVALDFAAARDVATLRRLLKRADIVLESARPRALAQLGCLAAEIVAARPGRVWVSITGHGRSARRRNWVAFGDDAATAAGLASTTGRAAGADGPLFCADAIADPLTGLHAAVATLAAWRNGGGVLVSLALRAVAAHALGAGTPSPEPVAVHRRGDGDDWDVAVGGERRPVRAPHARTPLVPARLLGADTGHVLRELHV